MSEHLNYFTGSEREKQQRFCAVRARMFRPLLVLLDRTGITPNFLSFLSLLSMAGFVYFVPTNMLFALGFVLLHIFFDGIDGSLARYQDTASNAGALADICVDQGGLVIAVLTLIFYKMIDAFFGAWYLVMYIVMITFLVLLNRLGSPVRFAIRSKYFFYILLVLDLYTARSIVHPFLVLFACYMTVLNVHLFLRLRKLV
ncbi:hypothetical protein A2454_04570 [Candidatus Peribacteria bacterium RIFOXYC2_FULL_55_14]|nr:MAG: Phosphatidylglycerophosphate synthase [Candidatus Peribacteria bacterium GW2011_GWB1_54_5]KKW37537.1 MAG: Phosphatidylglycerophosphate synthase [Candidatus Peribacteria bacterium GW2011_GWC2_54_8]KKW44428.1 MAG: Phosphatidylglycerophosphate synthase [Candidatus Peregrinibacteria bacterium GW2011_GWA2_54_9]OGJ70985.1 MAG: hypothetical protein A2198_01095 [Candidatus Peribacteria bacterium RIFOXYA1_FULL_56_14]OGJ74279.1 MAG: hypothetical protein A2384_06130 [Candidatus Peribacteria bacter